MIPFYIKTVTAVRASVIIIKASVPFAVDCQTGKNTAENNYNKYDCDYIHNNHFFHLKFAGDHTGSPLQMCKFYALSELSAITACSCPKSLPKYCGISIPAILNISFSGGTDFNIPDRKLAVAGV